MTERNAILYETRVGVSCHAARAAAYSRQVYQALRRVKWQQKTAGARDGSRGVEGPFPKPWKNVHSTMLEFVFGSFYMLQCIMYDTVSVNSSYLLFERLSNDKCRLNLLCTKLLLLLLLLLFKVEI